jgi:hypothetical protein
MAKETYLKWFFQQLQSHSTTYHNPQY